MQLMTLTNEYKDGVGRLSLLPGVWMENPSGRIDPQFIIGGSFSEGWKFGFPVFLSRTSPPDSIALDSQGTGVIVNEASYKLSESGSNGKLTFPTDAPGSQADLLLLIQINGDLQGLSLNNALNEVIYSHNQLLDEYPHAFIDSPDPAFTSLMVVPQGTQLIIYVEGEGRYLQVFDATQPIGQGVKFCFKNEAKENKDQLIEAAVARACQNSSDNIVRMTTLFAASALRARA